MSPGALAELLAHPLLKDADRSGCYGDGTADTKHMGKFTVTSASQVHVLPSECYGRTVRMYCTQAFEYFFTFASGATIALSGAATAAGLRAATQGELVPATTLHEVVVPRPPAGGSVYLARIRESADGVLHVVLADGTVGVVGD